MNQELLLESGIGLNVGVNNNYIEFTGVKESGVKIDNLQITSDYKGKLAEFEPTIDTETSQSDILGFSAVIIIIPIPQFIDRYWSRK